MRKENKHTREVVELLKALIAIPSFSREEERTADIISNFLQQKGIQVHQHLNNVWVRNLHFSENLPTILLNSHHDTVRPSPAYTKDPFEPIEEGGKLYGLGSNDAGGPLVSLLGTFLHFYDQPNLKYNLVFAATAEEEISGRNGIESLLPLLGKMDCAIVGEPTKMELAVAEKGLLVFDCTAKGKSGHAARNEGKNALYIALEDIMWLRNHPFQKISPLLGPVHISVTSIETENKAHNVVPDVCRFTVDVRVNELYTLDEIAESISKGLRSLVIPRGMRIRSTSIATDHPLVVAGLKIGKQTYGSPTTSDKALMPFPALKMGPGDSARSHTADEFIFLDEISEGINDYIQLLNEVL